MLRVFVTVDVELWCESWQQLDAGFPEAFASHIIGRTSRGDYGVAFQARMLREHGLQGVFFVDPLFATRFGPTPLADTVGMVQLEAQDVQLHLHTEWLDEAPAPLFPHITDKRPLMRQFQEHEQRLIIEEGLRLLRDAGAPRVDAFRAGNFGFNAATLPALAANGIRFDSSYNACVLGPESGLLPGVTLTEPVEQDGVLEFPVTVFRDGTGTLRPLQITACSWAEIEAVLWKSLEAGRQSVVIVSHGFELLDATRSRLDPIALRRFRKLCEFLGRHRDQFPCGPFSEPAGPVGRAQPRVVRPARWTSALRLAEQGVRRLRY